VIGGAPRFWLLTCALPTIAFPLVLAAVDTAYDDGLRNQLLGWLLAVPGLLAVPPRPAPLRAARPRQV
jgi:hypothetical protein